MNNYDNDLRNFYNKVVDDARVTETTTDMTSSPGVFRYMKEKSWNAPRDRKEDAYGVWVEIVEIWEEKVFQTISERCVGDNVYEEMKKVTEIIYHTDIEYYCYGNVDNCMKSQYVHTTYTKKVTE